VTDYGHIGDAVAERVHHPSSAGPASAVDRLKRLRGRTEKLRRRGFNRDATTVDDGEAQQESPVRREERFCRRVATGPRPPSADQSDRPAPGAGEVPALLTRAPAGPP